MNKTEYLDLRNSNNILQLLYVIYLEKCEEKKIQSYPNQKFIQLFNIWAQFANIDYNLILKEYDIKFDIRELSIDKKIIKYI